MAEDIRKQEQIVNKGLCCQVVIDMVFEQTKTNVVAVPQGRQAAPCCCCSMHLMGADTKLRQVLALVQVKWTNKSLTVVGRICMTGQSEHKHQAYLETYVDVAGLGYSYQELIVLRPS